MSVPAQFQRAICQGGGRVGKNGVMCMCLLSLVMCMCHVHVFAARGKSSRVECREVVGIAERAHASSGSACSEQ